MRAIVEDVTEMLKKHPDIAQDQTLFVSFTEFNASSLDFLVYTFTRTTEWVPFQMIQQDVLLRIADIVASHGAQIAYPTQKLHLAKDESQTAEVTNEGT